MLRLVVLLSLLALSLACKPTTTPKGTRKREVHQADVFVETKLKFDPALNAIYMKALKEGIEQHANEHQVMYDHDMVHGVIQHNGCVFAMKYTVYGIVCEEICDFIQTGKVKTDLIGNVTVECDVEATAEEISDDFMYHRSHVHKMFKATFKAIRQLLVSE